MTRICVCHGWIFSRFIMLSPMVYQSGRIHTNATCFNRPNMRPHVTFCVERNAGSKEGSNKVRRVGFLSRTDLPVIENKRNFATWPKTVVHQITRRYQTSHYFCNIPSISTKRFNAIITNPDSRVSSWLASYEQLIGVKDVKESQEKVTEMEKKFLHNRQLLKNSRQELEGIQSDLQAIRNRLDRTSREDPKFLEYATEEHRMIQQEKKVKENYHHLLDIERETFDQMSASVRESHVKQKAQEEKTKYWSIIGSVVGTVIGIIGSTVISQRRTRDLRGMVNDLKEQIEYLGGGGAVQAIDHRIDGDVAEKILAKTGDQLKSQEAVVEQLLTKHEQSIRDQVKRLDRSLAGSGGTGHVTDLERMIENTQEKLEWEVKMSTLATVVFVYGAFAIVLPVLYNIFK